MIIQITGNVILTLTVTLLIFFLSNIIIWIKSYTAQQVRFKAQDMTIAQNKKEFDIILDMYKGQQDLRIKNMEFIVEKNEKNNKEFICETKADLNATIFGISEVKDMVKEFHGELRFHLGTHESRKVG